MHHKRAMQLLTMQATRVGATLTLQEQGISFLQANQAIRLQRSAGEARVSFRVADGRTRLFDLYQSGCSKIRFPRRDHDVEGVLINTSGGLTDDDELAFSGTWAPKASAVLTSQAAERVYKSRGAPARVVTTLKVDDGASAAWVPQETIVFDGGSLERRTEVELAANATFFAVESMVFGRAAMGEVVRDGYVSDRWRVSVDGHLCLVDNFTLKSGPEGAITDVMARGAIADGATAWGTIIVADAEPRLDAVRAAVSEADCLAGASDLGELLVARIIAKDSRALRAAITNVYEAVRGTALPRVWNC